MVSAPSVGLAAEVVALQEVLLGRATDAGDAYLPGYTHLQRAQPVLLAHHLLAHAWALARDVDRLIATIERMDVSPLGAGALAGSSLPLDPDFVAEALGFHARFENSLDAVSDRDFVAEALFDIALLGVHLSRMGEEIVLWSTEEFGFCTLADAYATGSSMLPQKKNPDVAELARGKAGRLIGHLTGLLVTLKGLPLAYNRDLQEDKEPLIDSVQQAGVALRALAGLFSTIEFHQDRMQAAADGSLAAAVDLAEYLVEQGVPFRKAHTLVGGLVRDSLERHVPLAELVQAHPDLGDAGAKLLEPGVAVSRRTTPGGAGSAAVAEQLERFSRRLGVDRTRLGVISGEEHGRARREPPRRFGAGLATAALGGPARRRTAIAQHPARPRRTGRAHRGGRGLSGPGGSGLPRISWSDQTERDHVRSGGPPVRVFHLWHALVRECRVRTGVRRRRCAPAGRCTGRRHRGHVGGAARRHRERDLCNGPAKLCQAMGLTGDFDGADLLGGDLGVRLCSDGTEPPKRPGNGARIGITAAAERRWRWWITGDPNVSGRAAAPADRSDAGRRVR